MKKVLEMILALGVIAIGVYMLFTNDAYTAPFLSGLGFLLSGVLLWLPNCPICKSICDKK
jgi:drug/metabolite transporter (DMT)-like permease